MVQPILRVQGVRQHLRCRDEELHGLAGEEVGRRLLGRHTLGECRGGIFLKCRKMFNFRREIM